jgi:hypothetical protein
MTQLSRWTLLAMATATTAACGSQSHEFGATPDPDAGDTIEYEASTFSEGGRTDGGDGIDRCHVPPDGTSVNAPTCTKSSPPNSFNPVLKWSWTAPAGGAVPGSIITPLVAEMVDTNHDGEVNLCDIPSVIVSINGGIPGTAGKMVMLAGDTGQVQVTFDGDVDGSITPALGDIDGDKVSEVVTNDLQGHLVAYDNKGKVKWTGPDIGQYKATLNSYCLAIAIYDLNGDGKPEIIDGFEVFDNEGHSKFSHDESAFANHYWCPAPTAADLDGDGKQEVIFGNAAYHSDGTLYWTIPGPPGQPQVADFDKDGVPEVFVAREDGLLVVSHDGNVLSGPVQSFDPGVSDYCWNKAGAVADFDGTGHPSMMDGSCAHFGIWHVSSSMQMSLLWSAAIDDGSGVASSTAFDFLGRGIHDAIYGDQDSLWAFDGKAGGVEVKEPRASGTLIEYPVVADVDNDGSADIVVVSNKQGDHPENYMHTVDVYQDSGKRWIPTRRIWNQHAYHVTNVREDGTIPAHQQNNWQKLNTFRVNSQVENGIDCAPPPPSPN